VTIKAVYDTLKESEQLTLTYALEHSLSQYIEYKKGKYIGVNTEYISYLTPEVIVGKWSIGSKSSD